MSHSTPQTSLAPASEKVAQPGNLTLSWKAADPWHTTDDSRLQYSLPRWIPSHGLIHPERQHSFFSLPTGRHHFEVRARDNDFNVDPHPASLDFVVLPPVWKQGWFLGLLTVFAAIIALQAARIVSRGRHLRRTNLALAAEIEERKRIQAEVEKAQKQLLEASRQAGMAEVATNVLHNVGNVLNSVNVSADLLMERVRESQAGHPAQTGGVGGRTCAGAEFPGGAREGQNGSRLFERLSGCLAAEKGETLKELCSLRQNIEHIKKLLPNRRNSHAWQNSPNPSS